MIKDLRNLRKRLNICVFLDYDLSISKAYIQPRIYTNLPILYSTTKKQERKDN